MRLRLFSLLLLSVVEVGCATTDQPVLADAGAITSSPYYRFWRGTKRSDLTDADFTRRLADNFMPLTVRVMAPLGLVSYTIALPPPSAPKGFPTELALVAYQSEDAYKKARETPEGKAYQNSHWDLFAKDLSKSVVPFSFKITNPTVMKPDTAYDVLEKPINWQTGLTYVYVGKRSPSMTKSAFLGRLTKHVRLVADVLGRGGLAGYLVLGTDEYEIAWLNWPDQETMDKAMSSAEGIPVVNDAGKFMESVMFEKARVFDGKAKTGECLAVKF